MLRCLSLLAVFTFTAGLLAQEGKKALDEKGSVKPKVVGLSIHKPLPAKKGVTTFEYPGLTLDVAVKQPGKFIVGVDAKASKLNHFTDDKQTDLHKSQGFFAPDNWINDFVTRISSDGETCTVQLSGHNTPAKGAEKILFKGSLALKCGAGEKATDKKELTLKVNEETSLGDFKAKVNFASDFGSGIAITSDKLNVKNAEFFDSNGKAIKITPPTRMTIPMGVGKAQHTLSYFLNGKHDKLSVKITYFEKVENVIVPLDLKVGLDLE